MSRHNKWSKIKNKKGATDARRGATFTKLSRAITVAARSGVEPDMNFKLRLAILAAREANMPKDTIERAIVRATGAGDESELHEMTYEAFGPGGVGLMIEAVTDSTNRTAGNVKNILTKGGGNLSGPGSVAWQFERKGIIRVSQEVDEALELAFIEAGADDIKKEEGGTTIQVSVDGLRSTLEVLAAKNISPEYSGLEWIPRQAVPADAGTSAKLEALVDALEADEDVSSVFTNEA